MNNEDIEILKDFIKDKNIFIQIEKLTNPTVNQTIENLLKENQANKEKIKGMVDNNAKLIEVTNLYLDSIPKLKLREKIHDLKEALDFVKTGRDERSKIQAELLGRIIRQLEELLQE